MLRLKFILFFLVIYNALYATEFIMTIPDGNQKEVQQILSKNNSYKSVDFIKIDLTQILEKNEYSITIGKEHFLVKKDTIDARGVNNFFFVASNGDTHVMISVLDSDIQGVIETPTNVYSIETYKKNRYILITVDYSMLHEICNENEIIENENMENLEESALEIDDNITGEDVELKSYSDYDCKIRVLVLYTSSAESSVSNIINTVNTAVSLTNQSFVNSLINYRIELAYLGKTSYTESGSYTTDLQRFRNTNDGYMDEVHNLREKYSADICVLLSYYTSLCGIAYGIGTSSSDAFCLVSAYSTCATTNYSFGHEIGHLLGCRHDTYVDSNTTPFAYGHGYINPSKTWRTIMAYANGCSTCPRLLYWSNPNVTYSGTPMGTTTTEYNAKVWNNQASTFMAYKQPPNTVTATNTIVNSNSDYLNIQAKQTIQSSGTVNIDKDAVFTSGSTIVFNPGVTITGDMVNARISNVSDCGDCKGELKSFNNLSHTQVNEIQDYNIEVYPNPTNNEINISYNLQNNSIVDIYVVNLFAEKVLTISNNESQKANRYLKTVSFSNLTPAVYFIVCKINNETITRKIILK